MKPIATCLACLLLAAAPAARAQEAQPPPDRPAAGAPAAPPEPDQPRDGEAAPQTAAAVAAAPAVPDTPCELHVWPAERFQAQTTGWGAAFGLLGSLIESAANAEGDKGRRSAMASALDPEAQGALLAARDLNADLALRPARIIVHEQPLDRKTMNKVKTRRSDSRSPCYAELIDADFLY